MLPSTTTIGVLLEHNEVIDAHIAHSIAQDYLPIGIPDCLRGSSDLTLPEANDIGLTPVEGVLLYKLESSWTIAVRALTQKIKQDDGLFSSLVSEKSLDSKRIQEIEEIISNNVAQSIVYAGLLSTLKCTLEHSRSFATNKD